MLPAHSSVQVAMAALSTRGTMFFLLQKPVVWLASVGTPPKQTADLGDVQARLKR
jgi:hypothetical protein